MSDVHLQRIPHRKMILLAGVIALSPLLYVGTASVARAECGDDAVTDCSDRAQDAAREAINNPDWENLQRAINTTTNCMRCGLENLGDQLQRFGGDGAPNYNK
jgi:hypothetical protein